MGRFGLTEIAVRLASWDQRRQFELFVNEIAPAFAPSGARAGA